MISLNADLHTHTVHSHGTGTVEDNIKQAISLGLKRIAITDHGNRHVSYGIRDMESYLADIENMKRKYAGVIDVLAGVEFNLCSLDGRSEDFSAYADRLDIKLLGYHKFTAMRDARSYFYYYLTPRKDIVKNTDAIIAALEKNDIDILTHPGYAAPGDIKEVAAACKRTDTLFEINEKHAGLSADDIILAAEQGTDFIVSSDAHASVNVGRVPHALEKLIESGLPLERVINVKG